MKVTNIQYSTLDELKQNLDISKLDTSRCMLQVFTGFVEEDEVHQLHRALIDKNASLQFIGTTTAGEIYSGNIYEKTIDISIMEFEMTTPTVGFFETDDDFATGQELAETLFQDDTQAVILFIDGLHTNGNDVIDGISSINNEVTIAGGLAGDNGFLKQTYVFNNSGVYSKGCVAASLNSKHLHVSTQYQLNWQPIGKVMQVTKAEKNRLYEIDNLSASEIYTKYLGKRIGDNLPFSATEFPLLKIEDDGLEICRVFIHKFEDGSLLTIGNLNVGDNVRLAFGNVDLIINDTRQNIAKYAPFKPEAIYIYSCTSRKLFLQSEIVAELEPFNKIAPNIGFFTYGEIYHHNNKNALLNTSLTTLALSEHYQEFDANLTVVDKDAEEKNIVLHKHYLVLDALIHLSNSVISELQDAQKQLEEQANRDYLTQLYNRRYFNEVAQQFIHIVKREKKDFSVIILDIDKFKSINDTYGHNVGDEVIKSLAHIILKNIRESDIVARYGGEEFALLLPFTDKVGALTLAEKIRKAVQNAKIQTSDGDIVNFTISLGVDAISTNDTTIDEALNRADKALYLAKKGGRNKAVLASQSKQ